jgi:hypothetical protein
VSTVIRRRSCARVKRLGLCVICGYDLRGQTERCPECGTQLPDVPAH